MFNMFSAQYTEPYYISAQMSTCKMYAERNVPHKRTRCEAAAVKRRACVCVYKYPGLWSGTRPTRECFDARAPTVLMCVHL